MGLSQSGVRDRLSSVLVISVRRRSLILILVACVLLLSPIWLPWVGTFLVISEPLQKADAIVILAGDENERIAYGAALFQEGFAEWYVLTDMRLDRPGSAGKYAATVTQKAIKQAVPAERVLVVPGTVGTTYEEATRIRTFVVQRGFRSLIVITSPYHGRRAQWILDQAFRDAGITLIVRSVPNHQYYPETWWESSEGRRFTITEYLKLTAHLLGFRSYDQYGPHLENWLKALHKRIFSPERQPPVNR